MRAEIILLLTEQRNQGDGLNGFAWNKSVLRRYS